FDVVELLVSEFLVPVWFNSRSEFSVGSNDALADIRAAFSGSVYFYFKIGIGIGQFFNRGGRGDLKLLTECLAGVPYLNRNAPSFAWFWVPAHCNSGDPRSEIKMELSVASSVAFAAAAVDLRISSSCP